MKTRIGIIGGGISGLVCAYELKRAGAEVTVFERAEAGGRMSSIFSKEGLCADLGANFYRGDNKNIQHYCGELGVPYKPVEPVKPRMTLYKGKPYHTEFLPWKDSILSQPGIIKNIGPGIKLAWQALFSGRGMYDLTQTPAYLSDEPIQTLAKQIGEDFDHYVCAAPIEGLTFYGTDKMTHSFLVNGARQSILSNFTKRHFSGPMRTLPTAFAKVLPMKNETVTKVTPTDTGAEVVTNAGNYAFDAVVIATPNTRDFFTDCPEHQELITKTEYSKTVAGGYEFPAEIIKDFAMIYIPHRENNIMAIVLNEGRKQIVNGKAIFGFATHDKATREILDSQTDEEVDATIRGELQKLFPQYKEVLEKAPLLALKRWERAIPIYTPAHMRRVRTFLENHQGKHNVYLTGDLLGTPFVEGSLTSGVKTARAVIKDFHL